MDSHHARAARLTASLDPDLARFVHVAVTSYRRACVNHASNLLPSLEALDLLEAALLRVARSGQLRALALSTRDPRRMTAAGFLNYREAASVVGLSERTVRRRVATGDLPAYRSGRRVLIDPADLIEHIQGAA